MKWNDLRIGTRLGIGFALVLALLASVMAGGNMARERAMQQLGRGMRDVTTKTALADRMKTALLEGALFTRNIALQGDVAATQAEEEKVKAQRRRYAEARDQLAARGLSQAEKDILAEIDRLDQETREPMLEAVGQSLLFNVEEAAKVISMRIDPVQRRMIERINQLTLLQQDAAGELMERTADAARRLDALLYGLGALALVLGVLFSTAITRSITGPLRGAVAVARKVADGDLSSTIEAKGRDETGQLLQALQDMTGKLRTLVGDVAAGAHTVADTSGQIAHGNLDLSQRTEEQASTLEETASSMEELTSTVAQNAENARQASRLAQEASEIARRGGKVVGDVVSTMTGISDASRRIAHILGVIDGIAFQTNILALNAAVEAARAGDQGRGFAVVAAEVRGLAQRSAEAAKEIKTLIADSVDKVDAGARLVDTAGRTMQEIVGAAKQVSDLVAEIAAASQEQRSGIEQVNTAMAQMDQAVQQNASLVEEAAASTESLKEQAVALLQNVARFRLGAVDAAPEGLLRAEPAMALAAAPEPIRVRGRRAAALGAAAAGAIGVTAAAHAGQ